MFAAVFVRRLTVSSFSRRTYHEYVVKAFHNDTGFQASLDKVGRVAADILLRTPRLRFWFVYVAGMPEICQRQRCLPRF